MDNQRIKPENSEIMISFTTLGTNLCTKVITHSKLFEAQIFKLFPANI